MVERDQIPVSGCMNHWTLVPVDRAAVQDALERLGFEGFLPPEQGDTAALKAALAELKGKDRIVDSLKNPKKDGVEVVAVEKDHTANYRTQDYRCKVVDGVVVVAGGYFSDQEKLQAEFNKHKALATKNGLSGCLQQIAASLKAVTLWPGSYWVPESGLRVWERVVEEFRLLDKEIKFKLVRVQTDDLETVQAIRDALVQKVGRKAAEIRAEVEEKNLGQEGLERRAGEAQNLRELVDEYRQILGDWAATLADVIHAAEEAAVVAGLKAMATV